MTYLRIIAMLIVLTPLGCTLYRSAPDRDVDGYPGWRAIDYRRVGVVGPKEYTIYVSDEEFVKSYPRFSSGQTEMVWWTDMAEMREFGVRVRKDVKR